MLGPGEGSPVVLELPGHGASGHQSLVDDNAPSLGCHLHLEAKTLGVGMGEDIEISFNKVEVD